MYIKMFVIHQLNIIKKKQRKNSKKSFVKGIKISQKKKETKKQEYHFKLSKNLSEDEKQKLAEY